jgi:5-methylcytosine-specific restriction endonuclease McrA
MSTLSASRIAQLKCEQYEYQDRRKYGLMKPQYKNASQKWQSCQCMICGEHLDMLTEPHALLHGYPDKKSIIAAGYIRFLGGS